jgi:long-chain acyl-CoA synthetase
LKPTFFATVPRILNIVYDRVHEGISKKPKIIQWLFKKGLETKLKNFKKSGQLTHFFYDKLIFNKISKQFGGSIKLMYVAAAPVSTEVYTFFRLALSAKLVEIYGLTEVAGAAIMGRYNDKELEYRTGITPQCKARLKDLPELNCYSTDKPYPRGEV